MKVEIGCGGTKNEGFIGIDRFELPGVDVVADINEGLPIEENRVSLLFSSHSLEHFADLPKVMKEIYRVCKHGAQVCIVVPYHETLLNKANPYHLQVFNEHTFRFFSKENNYFTESKDFIFPHAKDYGLLYSDNSNLEVNFVLANIEYFYFDGFDILSADEQRYYRKHCNDVCDQVVYHLLVVKEDLPEYEVKNLIKNTNLYYPNYVLERKEKLKNKIESLAQDEINEIKKSILNPITLGIFKNQEKKQQELEEQNSELNFKIENQEKKQQELEEQNSELNFKMENQEKKQQELEEQNCELNFKMENQEKKQQELEEQNSELNFKIENQIRLFSLYTKNKQSLFQKINYFKFKDNIVENMNIGSFNKRMVMNLKNDMSNYKVKFSSFIKAYPYYNEYYISSNNKISSLEIYVDVFSKVNLTFEIVQNNKILHNQVVSVNKSGTLVLSFPEIENNFRIRFQVKSILEYMTIAEWYPSHFLAKLKNNTLLCYVTN